MSDERRLYGWDVDRDGGYVRIEEGPFDDEGNDLVLFHGAVVDESVTINLQLPRKGKLADFLYSPQLLLYVSERVLEVVKRGNVPNIRVNPVVLRDAKGRAVNDTYSWINPMLAVPLLDRERSALRASPYGIERVEKLVIKKENVPPDDLFLLKELSLPIFTDTLVRPFEAAGLDGAVFEPIDTLTWGV